MCPYIAFRKKTLWHERLPAPLSWLWNGWMGLSKAIGAVMSRILLTILWIVGFGVYAIPMKIAAIFRKPPAAGTYWRDVLPEPPENMARQF